MADINQTSLILKLLVSGSNNSIRRCMFPHWIYKTRANYIPKACFGVKDRVKVYLGKDIIKQSENTVNSR